LPTWNRGCRRKRRCAPSSPASSLPISATYVIDSSGTLIYADTDADYRDRADPEDVLRVLAKRAAAA
jgi:hypothetical protein